MFGITSAPEVYQPVIQQALPCCEGMGNIAHHKRLQRVRQTLKKKNLTLNAKKCKFYMTEMVFMKRLLTDKGIEEVRAIVDARQPQNALEVRHFLGLSNYNALFIPDVAAVAESLCRLTKKGVRFLFGNEQRKAFTELKKRLSSAETLGYFDKNAKTLIVTDAGPVGLGAVLIQEQHGVKRFISYASKRLSNVEKRYSQTQKGPLAIFRACERFHVFLYGTEFKLYTDHKPSNDLL